MKKILFLLLLAIPMLAGNLQLKSGFVLSHAEMIMDSKIDSVNNALHVEANIQGDDITSITGKFWVEVDLFVSDKKDRDEHMDETTEVKKYPLATYMIENITKEDGDNNYILHGTMDFHGVKKELSFFAQIINNDNNILINAEAKILGSDYGLEMPCMVFMCVDDEIGLLVEIILNKTP